LDCNLDISKGRVLQIKYFIQQK